MPVLFTFNLQTKFEMSNFIRSKDMAWAPKCRNESRDFDHAPFGDDDISKLGLATINLKTKFEVSDYTHYEDMRSGAIERMRLPIRL